MTLGVVKSGDIVLFIWGRARGVVDVAVSIRTRLTRAVICGASSTSSPSVVRPAQRRSGSSLSAGATARIRSEGLSGRMALTASGLLVVS